MQTDLRVVRLKLRLNDFKPLPFDRATLPADARESFLKCGKKVGHSAS